MGIPVTAAYLITSELAVPILTTPEMGIPIIAAHLIIFWLSQDSNITPPVALGAYAGAAIARADPWKTGWACFKFSKLLYIIAAAVRVYAHPVHRRHFLFLHTLCGIGCRWHSYLLRCDDGFFSSVRRIGMSGYCLRSRRFLAYVYNVWTFAIAIVLVAVVYTLQNNGRPL